MLVAAMRRSDGKVAKAMMLMGMARKPMLIPWMKPALTMLNS